VCAAALPILHTLANLVPARCTSIHGFEPCLDPPAGANFVEQAFLGEAIQRAADRLIADAIRRIALFEFCPHFVGDEWIAGRDALDERQDVFSPGQSRKTFSALRDLLLAWRFHIPERFSCELVDLSRDFNRAVLVWFVGGHGLSP
jgi:hypothetical protein